MALNLQEIDALLEARDRKFVERVSQEYNLDFKELYSKYVETAEAALIIPRKYQKQAVSSNPAPSIENKCQGITAKNEPCKFSALSGTCFCKRHSKTGTETSSHKSTPIAKMQDPVHTHEMDDVVHEDCALCQTHGNAFTNSEMEFEIVITKE